MQDFDKIQWGKGLTLFDPRLIELQKEYARNLLTHLNPYTGNEYRNEPAIAIVELLNENALYLGFRAPTPYYDEELTRIFNLWLQQKRSSRRAEEAPRTRRRSRRRAHPAPQGTGDRRRSQGALRHRNGLLHRRGE